MNNIAIIFISAVVATIFSLVAFVRSENKRRKPFPEDRFDSEMRSLYREELPVNRREKHAFTLSYRNQSAGTVGFICDKCNHQFVVKPYSLFNMEQCKELLIKQSEFCNEEVISTIPTS